jgi:hypothetical protein
MTAFGVGRYLGKSPGMLHRELPLEYAYFQAKLGMLTDNPEVALTQVDKSLAIFSKPLYMSGVDKRQASMQRSFLLALRSRALAALHRAREAQEAADMASKFCAEAGRQSCDGARLVDYSKRLLKTDWE